MNPRQGTAGRRLRGRTDAYRGTYPFNKHLLGIFCVYTRSPGTFKWQQYKPCPLLKSFHSGGDRHKPKIALLPTERGERGSGWCRRYGGCAHDTEPSLEGQGGHLEEWEVMAESGRLNGTWQAGRGGAGNSGWEVLIGEQPRGRRRIAKGQMDPFIYTPC